MDAGVDVSHREVIQVVAVAAVDRKNPDLMGLAGLQLVEESAAPLFPHYLHACPHCPWVHLQCTASCLLLC